MDNVNSSEFKDQRSESLLNRIVVNDGALMKGIKRIAGRTLQSLQASQDRRVYGREVDFSSWVAQEEVGFDKSKGNEYQPSYIPSLKKALALYDIKAEDALIDIGSGKGKILAVCSEYPFHKLCGLELSAPLAEIGRKNMSILGLEDKCETLVADAAEFDAYDEYTFIYMFNTLPREVLRVALQKIEESIVRTPRRCVFIYMNPQHHDVLDESKVFHRGPVVKNPLFWYTCYCYETQSP